MCDIKFYYLIKQYINKYYRFIITLSFNFNGKYNVKKKCRHLYTRSAGARKPLIRNESNTISLIS